MARKLVHGWNPDLPDHRDHSYAVPAHIAVALPPQVDLRPGCPPVYDQGQLGSCTANAIAGAMEFDRLKEKLEDWTPSRLFIYRMERSIEGTIDSDSGAQIRDGVKAVAKKGAPPESLWPYDIEKFTDLAPPEIWGVAWHHKVISYQRVPQTLSQLRGCLAAGYPVIFGFTVYESFESQEVAETGVLSLPSYSERAVGGHAVLLVGYDDASQRFIVRNSWGPNWGMQGYFTMPYAYLTDHNLADDFWTIRTVK